MLMGVPSAGVAAPVTMTPVPAGTMPTPEIVAPPVAMPRGDARVLPAPPGGSLSAQTPTDANPKVEASKPAEAIRLADPVRPPEALPPIGSVPGVR